MESPRFPLFLVLFLLAVVSVSASNFISDAVFESQASFPGRNLLQAKKPCPVNFEFLNYTIITSRCKGPKYPADECCSAFKDFACPYTEQINDLASDCATTMFSYITLYGKYPPGLFASECKEGKEGLACPALPPDQVADDNGSKLYGPSSFLLMLTTLFFSMFIMFPCWRI